MSLSEERRRSETCDMAHCRDIKNPPGRSDARWQDLMSHPGRLARPAPGQKMVGGSLGPFGCKRLHLLHGAATAKTDGDLSN